MLTHNWMIVECRRMMPDGSRRHAWTEDGERWSARVIDATNALQHEALNAFATAERAMTWADTEAES